MRGEARLIRVLAPSMTGINDKAIAIDKALRQCQENWGIDEGDGKWVFLAEFIRHCEGERIAGARTVRKWAHVLEERGYWDLHKQTGNRYQYQPRRRLTAAEACLPTPADVEAWLRAESQADAADTKKLSEQERADRFEGGDEE